MSRTSQDTGAPVHASNRDDEAMRAQFRRRYLAEFARYTASDMTSSRNAGMKFLFLVIALVGGPLAPILGAGLLIRYFQVARELEPAIAGAVRQVMDDLQSGRDGGLAAVEEWLDRHAQQLVAYMDKLDRRDDDRRRLAALIDRINRLGSAYDIGAEDRAFLAHHGLTRLKPPLAIPYLVPPRCLLSNWHHAQLARALWRDIKRRARPGRTIIRRMSSLRTGVGAEPRASG